MDNEAIAVEEPAIGATGGDQMPLGEVAQGQVRREQVTVGKDGETEPKFDDQAAAEIVWDAYTSAKTFLEENSWLLDWQAIDFHYQNQNNDRWQRPADGRPVRISRYLIAKNVNTVNNQCHRAIWGNQKPFAFQPEGETTEVQVEAWTHLIWLLLKRSKAEYHFGLAGFSARLFGTGILQPGWEVKKVKKKTRKRVQLEPTATMPMSGDKKIATQESDNFKVTTDTVEESWPFIEYKPLGYTFFDENWRTPNAPEESAGYTIDYDLVEFQQLQQLRALEIYKKIPNDETLIKFFIENVGTDAAAPSATAQGLADGHASMALHAIGEWKNRGINPFKTKLALITQWTPEQARAILVYQGRKLTIRNGPHDMGDHALHYAFNWWNVPNSGWGMGIGKVNLDDQRMETGVLNEVLKMIGMWFNTPLLIKRGANAPTQDLIAGLASFLQVDTGPDGDVRKSIGYIERPAIPAEAWKVMDMSLHGGEDVVGANSTTMQGNLGGAGSSAMRTAAGVNRVGGKADETIAEPVLHESMALQRFIEFLVDQVRLKMPVAEIRQLLRRKYSQAIIDAWDWDKFLNAEFILDVLAGQKMMARAAIQQLIPFILQILQQPQIQNFYNMLGKKLDYEALFSILIRMSELDGNIDNIFSDMTEKEKESYKQNSPGAQKVAGALQVEQARGENKIKETQAKGQTDLTTHLAEIAAEHAGGAVPLERAQGLMERSTDENELRNGVPDPLAQ